MEGCLSDLPEAVALLQEIVAQEVLIAARADARSQPTSVSLNRMSTGALFYEKPLQLETLARFLNWRLSRRCTGEDGSWPVQDPAKTKSVVPEPPKGIFGVPLRDSIKYANVAISLVDENGKSYIYGYVPIVVAKCGVFLKEKGSYKIIPFLPPSISWHTFGES